MPGWALGTAFSAHACMWRPVNGPLSTAPGRTQGSETIPANQVSGSQPQPALPPQVGSSQDPLWGCEMAQHGLQTAGETLLPKRGWPDRLEPHLVPIQTSKRN